MCRLLRLGCTFFSFFKIYVTVTGLSCGMWDLVPRSGIEPRPQALGARRFSHWTTREVAGLHLIPWGGSRGSMDFWARHHAMRGPLCMPRDFGCVLLCWWHLEVSARDRCYLGLPFLGGALLTLWLVWYLKERAKASVPDEGGLSMPINVLGQ